MDTEKRYLLAICIPTYNRASILENTLDDIIPKIKGQSFIFVVSDNNSTDNTEEICRKYSNVIYHKNKTNIGLEKNLIKALRLGKDYADYLWLMGDSQILIGNSEIIFNNLSSYDFNLILLGRLGTLNKDFKTKSYNDINLFLQEVGYSMDMIASVIVKSEAIQERFINHSLWSIFPHMIISLEYLSKLKNPRMLFLKEIYTHQTPLFKQKLRTAWYSKTFEYFSENWFLSIISLNSYSKEAKLKAIKKHDKYFPNFSTQRLLFLRQKNFVGISDLMKYKNWMPFVSDTPIWKMKFILLLPPYICKFYLWSKEVKKKFLYNLKRYFKLVLKLNY